MFKTLRIRHGVAAAYAKKNNVGFISALFRVREAIGDDDIEMCGMEACQQLKIAIPPSAMVGGQFLDWLLAFLNSPQGQALLQALIALLLGML